MSPADLKLLAVAVFAIATLVLLVTRFKVYRCWPSEYAALADLDAQSPVGIETLVLEYEGFERDLSVK